MRVLSLGLLVLFVIPFATAAISITSCGSLNQPGQTYILQNDVSNTESCFKVKADGITLDLNGHTVTYGTGPLVNQLNLGFEDDSNIGDGLLGWDISQAPSAKLVSGPWWDGTVSDGSYALRFKEAGYSDGNTDQYILSDLITIPAGRGFVLMATHHVPDYRDSTGDWNNLTNVSYSVTIEPAGILRTDYFWCSPLMNGTGGEGTTWGNSAFSVCPITPSPVARTARIKIRVNGPGLLYHPYNITFDEVRIVPAFDNGIGQANYADTIFHPFDQAWGGFSNHLTIKNGNIVQGAYGYEAYGIFLRGGNNYVTIKDVQVHVQGANAIGIWSRGDYQNIIGNTIINDGKIIRNRHQMDGGGMFIASHESGILHEANVTDNTIIGSPQYGLRVLGGKIYDVPKFVVARNNISFNNRYTNGFGIQSGSPFMLIANNTITVLNGRGIQVNAVNTTVTGNKIDVQEGRNGEYTSMMTYGIQFESDGGGSNYSRAFDNTIIARAKPAQNGLAVAVRLTGDSSNIAVFNNTIYAYSSTPSYPAYAFSAFGTDSPVQASTSEFYNNVVYSQSAIADFEFGGSNQVLHDNYFERIPGGAWYASAYLISPAYNTVFFDNILNGVDFRDAIYSCAYRDSSDLRVMYSFTVRVVDGASNPVSGATITVKDIFGSQEFSGVTGSNGSLTFPVYEFVSAPNAASCSVDNVTELNPHSVRAQYPGYDKTVLVTVDNKKTTTFTPSTVGCVDLDVDGYFTLACGGNDCNDNSASVYPGAQELCGDGIDQDCSGADLSCQVCGEEPAPAEGCLCQGIWQSEGEFCSAFMGDHIVLQQRYYGYSGAISRQLSQPHPNSIFGFFEVWYRADGMTEKGLVRFDISSLPVGREIQSANLFMYQSHADVTNLPGIAPVQVYKVLKSWNPEYVTWNCRNDPEGDGCSPVDAWTVSGLGVGDRDSSYSEIQIIPESWNSWNVTELVRDWYAGESNYGFLVETTTGISQCISGVENVGWNGACPSSSDPPRLEIDLVPLVVAPCGVYDADSSGVISMSESSSAIQDWYQGNIGMSYLVNVLKSWIDGVCYT
ncbi:MAG: DNRLRE domain-containing protein [Candidatus Woesearchaeota archaeon]